MKLLRSLLMMLILSCMNLSCGGNVLTSFGDRTTDDAILVDIKNYRNAGDYTSAISKFSELSAAATALQENQFLMANIYSESCGLDFLSMTEVLASASSSRLFPLVMGEMAGSTAMGVSHCIDAETIMYSMDSSFTLSAGEYLFMTFLGLAKIGAILNLNADTDSDGSRDVGFDACDSVDFPDTYAQHVATAFTLLQTGLVGMAASGDSSGADAATIVTAACTALGSLGPSFDFCGETDSTNITGDKLKGVRSLVKEDNDIGIGDDGCSGDITTCNCP